MIPESMSKKLAALQPHFFPPKVFNAYICIIRLASKNLFACSCITSVGDYLFSLPIQGGIIHILTVG